MKKLLLTLSIGLFGIAGLAQNAQAEVKSELTLERAELFYEDTVLDAPELELLREYDLVTPVAGLGKHLFRKEFKSDTQLTELWQWNIIKLDDIGRKLGQKAIVIVTKGFFKPLIKELELENREEITRLKNKFNQFKADAKYKHVKYVTVERRKFTKDWNYSSAEYKKNYDESKLLRDRSIQLAHSKLVTKIQVQERPVKELIRNFKKLLKDVKKVKFQSIRFAIK